MRLRTPVAGGRAAGSAVGGPMQRAGSAVRSRSVPTGAVGGALCGRPGSYRRGSRCGPQPGAGRRRQVRTIEPPSTLTDFSGSGDLAGPAVTDAVRDRELAAVARADDHPVGHRLDLAALVRAGRRERLELARGRLGDDHVLVGEHGAAADRDAGGRGQRRCRRSSRRRVRPTGRPDGAGSAAAVVAGAVAVEPPPQAVSSPAAATPPTPATTARLLRPGRPGSAADAVGGGRRVGHQLPRVVGAFAVSTRLTRRHVSPARWGESCGPLVLRAHLGATVGGSTDGECMAKTGRADRTRDAERR